MIKNRPYIPILLIAAILLVALLLRLHAANGLTVDFDEPVYFNIASDYASAVREGQWAAILAGDWVVNHPSLAKLLYAAVLVPQPPAEPLPEILPGTPNYVPPRTTQFRSLRGTAVLLGLANVLIVALVDPLAALFVALNTYTVKYTAQIYLEALPMLTSTIAVLAYMRAERKWNRWLFLSAVTLGLTAAAKYIYCIAGVAVLVDYLWSVARKELDTGLRTISFRGGAARLLLWAVVALVTFFLFNPVLWSNPIPGLFGSIFGNINYSQGVDVQNAGYPLYQPFIWLFSSVPWHPGVIVTRFDGLVALLALFGIPAVWRAKRVMVIWWAAGMFFLLLWPTKWPQYILVVTVPVSFCAAAAIRGLARRIRARGKSSTG